MNSILPAPVCLLQHLIKPYDFEDRGFVTGGNGVEPRPGFRYLARRCVALSKGYLVKCGVGWTHHQDRTVAVANVFDQHAGFHGGLTIDGEAVEEFFGRCGGLVQFAGECVVPGMPEMITMNGGRFVNTWRDTRLQPVFDSFEDSEVLLRLVFENLCDMGRGKSLLEILEIMEEDNHFRWVMHWLASLYLRPGVHIGTMLWLIGPNMGIGKGTLVQVMERLIGPQWCRKAADGEVEKGWTDFMLGKLLVVYDEFEMTSRRDLNRYFKEIVGNQTLELTKRHLGQIQVINVTNSIGTTNKENPLEISTGDRRHTFVRTSDDVALNRRPLEFWDMPEADRHSAMVGFAEVLASISIDTKFIRRPFDNDSKDMIVDESRGPVYRWLKDTDGDWKPGEERLASDLWQQFFAWMSCRDPNCFVKTETSFGTKLGEMPGITKRRYKGTRYTKRAYFTDADLIQLDDAEPRPSVLDRLKAKHRAM